MAHTEQSIAAPPERLFEIFADAFCFPHWVVGASRVRDVDDGFPAVGKRFHHTIGWGPFTLDDHTEVLDINPPYRLELRARARPLGTAKITMLVEPRGSGSYVTMIEDGADPLSKLLFNPLTHLLVHGRNRETLRRLKTLAERGPSATEQYTSQNGHARAGAPA